MQIIIITVISMITIIIINYYLVKEMTPKWTLSVSVKQLPDSFLGNTLSLN